MRIGFWDPFLPALGGGEKYLLSIMEEAIALAGAEVLLLDHEEPDTEGWERLGVRIAPEAFEHVALEGDESALTEASRDLDLLVVTTHDVPPRSLARRSVAMIQFPARHHRRPWHRAADAAGLRRAPAALASYDLFLCNTQFTRRHIAERLGVDATVLAPPIDFPAAEPPRKGAAILSVGRFFEGWHAKRHDVLIGAAGRLHAAGEPVELHLAGGLDRAAPNAHDYVKRLREMADGLPVTFHVDVSRAGLERLYAQAALYWHAAGFEQDERRHPERLEHFGMTTVEAMARGAVPLVYAAGGPAEVVEDGVSGLHWRTPEELAAASRELLADRERREAMARAARAAARRYSRERFGERVRAEVLSLAGAGA